MALSTSIFEEVAKLIVNSAGGRIRVTKDESPTSARYIRGNETCLKLDEKQVGRSLEWYGRYAKKKVKGWQWALCLFREEILGHLRRRGLPCPEAEAKLKELGAEAFPGNLAPIWEAQFA